MGYLTANGQLLTANNQYVISPYDLETIDLLNRMTLVGEEPTLARKLAINTTIISLKANDLFSNQFDVFVVTKGHGRESTKMNWIKNAHTALDVSSATFTSDIGWNSDGTYSYLNTQYNAATQGIKYQLNDACMLTKFAGTPLYEDKKVLGAIYWNGATYINSVLGFVPTASQAGFNNAYYLTGSIDITTAGYYANSRDNSATYNAYANNASTTLTAISSEVPNTQFYCMNCQGNSGVFTRPEIKVELYAFGKSLTQSKFLTLQSIMNTYFSSF